MKRGEKKTEREKKPQMPQKEEERNSTENYKGSKKWFLLASNVCNLTLCSSAAVHYSKGTNHY